MKNSLSKTLAIGTCTLAIAFVGCGSPDGTDDVTSSGVLDVQGPFIPENQVRSHLRSAGFSGSQVDTMVRIARCESSMGARSFAYGSNGLRHTGLWQISDLHKSACGYAGVSMSTFHSKMTAPGLNAKCARVVYVNAGGFGPWDCFTGRR
jgi:hypothetical protein